MAGEDVVPDVLKDAPRELVVDASGQQPFAVVDKALEGHFAYALARHGELRAPGAGQGGGNWRSRVDLLPHAPPPVNLLGLVEKVKVAARAIHVYPVGAAGLVVAADVHVSQARDAVVVEAFEHLRRVEAEEHVVVPGPAVGVHEDGRVGEVVVVVNDVGEVHLGGRC